MKYFLGAAALLAATASADLCSHGSTDDNGNYYCQKVNAISYTGVGSSGSYNKVTSMDGTAGTCSSSPQGYSGTLAPLDEELSVHFRGPLTLKQFAFYAPSGDSAPTYKRSAARKSAAERRHGHAHGHAHLHKHRDSDDIEEKRALGDAVTAVIDGQVVTWANDWAGGAATSAPAEPASTPASAPAAENDGNGSSDSASSSSSSGSSASDGASGGTGWTRQAYYNSEAKSADGLVFLNHFGGSGSGVFDYQFGNSLSYASADGSAGSASPQTLADTTLASSTEVILFSDSKCTDGSCGFARDGTVAYHGFNGPSKAFFFEFGMPSDGQVASSKYVPVDMPAIWLLNAQIPRTLQYGKPECSCWKSGCGEFDIFEVLAPGDERCKSTLHSNLAGGDSDYFQRPMNGTIKAALLLYQDNIHIKVLDDSTEFGSTMGSSFISEICTDTLAEGLQNLVSVFNLAG